MRSKKYKRTVILNIIVELDGMVCGMCETHIDDVIRKNFKVKKVSSSQSKWKTEIFSEEPIDDEKLEDIIGKPK